MGNLNMRCYAHRSNTVDSRCTYAYGHLGMHQGLTDSGAVVQWSTFDGRPKSEENEIIYKEDAEDPQIPDNPQVPTDPTATFAYRDTSVIVTGSREVVSSVLRAIADTIEFQ